MYLEKQYKELKLETESELQIKDHLNNSYHLDYFISFSQTYITLLDPL